MQRSTSIRLDDDLRTVLDREAREAGIPVAEVIRRSIVFYCAVRESERGRLPATTELVRR